MGIGVGFKLLKSVGALLCYLLLFMAQGEEKSFPNGKLINSTKKTPKFKRRYAKQLDTKVLVIVNLQ